ncbi:pilus assembly protein [Haliea sp. E17]|uniref:pilus assembly protein n=1 Tax=Haliea sp. E17 TaxID=3401576 RepID=UPI003AAB94A6
MVFPNFRKFLALAMAGLFAVSATAEDIDIFAGTSDTIDEDLPNVLFVLDNTSNWSRQAQQWPDGTQGESEARAIKAVLANQIGKINVGLMLYGTGGASADRDGGYVRIDMQELTQSYYDEIIVPILTRIEDNIEDSNEKRDSSNMYGYLPYDVYNYLAGEDQSKAGVGTPSVPNLTDANRVQYASADPDAYSSRWDTFTSPLTSDALCADNYMIYIGNNKNGSIAGDDLINTNALKAAYTAAGETAPDALATDSTGTPIPVPEVTCTETPIDPPVALPGTTNACYFSASACNTAVNNSDGETICDTTLAAGETCSCTATTGAYCDKIGNDRSYHYSVSTSGTSELVCELESEYDASTGLDYNLDDWSKFLFNVGVPITFSADLDEDGIDEVYNERVKVTSYMIDVFNAQQLPELSSLWYSAAQVGGGKYFQARDEESLEFALNITLGDIVAKASSFAAVTLPLSTTNRAQVDNEVYIGMFRPEKGKAPRWYGNLKRYQFATFNDVPKLADVQYREAINTQTGFPSDCAISFWSEDSGDYWEDLGIDPTVKNECATMDPNDAWSDSPDGRWVEKGGVGQQIRQLTYGADRTIYSWTGTHPSETLAELDTMDPNAVIGNTLYQYLTGDLEGDGEAPFAGATLRRPSVHGDVVHSRPLSIKYDDGSVVIYYGANDGMYRAADTSTGEEKWAFLAQEHFSGLQRLYDDAPKIKYEGELIDPNEPATEPKDYFFDGPTGYHIVYDDPVDPASEALGDMAFAYIYPTMRRGGSMVYGFDVTDPNNPSLLWRQGCDDTACTDPDFDNIGNTWSTPQGIFLAEYPGSGADPEPLVIFGGGYDACLDEDQAAYACDNNTVKGRGIYLLDAVDGDLVAYFDTDAPVITDVSLVDMDVDGVAEMAYVADVQGNIYRIRFADYVSNMAGLQAVPAGAIVHRVENDWDIETIAHMPDSELRSYNSVTAATTTTLGQVAVTFGSGDRERPLESNYPYADEVENRFYMLLDAPYEDYAAEQSAIAASESWTRDDIDMEDPNEIFQVGNLPAGKDLRDFRGWWMDLPNRGEQVANAAAVGGGKVFFNTFQPGGTSVGFCSSPIGVGRAYIVDLFSPTVVEGEEIPGGGFPIPPVIETVADIPEGCTAVDCSNYTPPDCSVPGNCQTLTMCIGGCPDGFNPLVLDPTIDPQIQRVFFTEEMDAESN